MEKSLRPDDPSPTVDAEPIFKTKLPDNPPKFGPQTVCPKCGSPPSDHQLREYDPKFHDGEVYCLKCGAYVRYWDADT